MEVGREPGNIARVLRVDQSHCSVIIKAPGGLIDLPNIMGGIRVLQSGPVKGSLVQAHQLDGAQDPHIVPWSVSRGSG